MKTTSRLANNLPVILDARKKRKSWRAICTLLESEYGITIGVGNLYRWFQRERKRARQLQAELGDFANCPKTSSSARPLPHWIQEQGNVDVQALDLSWEDPADKFSKLEKRNG